MARLRYNGLTATLGGSGLTAAATSVTFGAALTHSGGTAVPTLGAGDYIPLTIFDSTGNVSEIVNLTAYTSGATTGTIARAQEGTTAVTHASGDKVVHGPTASDLGIRPVNAQTGTAYTLTLSDVGRVVTGNNAAATTFTLPANATTAYPIGTQIEVVQLGTGQVQVALGSGVTANGGTSAVVVSKRYGRTKLVKLDTDSWFATGDIVGLLAGTATVRDPSGNILTSYNGATPTTNICDGDTSTYWQWPNGPANNSTAVVDFGANKAITQVNWVQVDPQGTQGYIPNYSIQWSTDNTNWTTLTTTTTQNYTANGLSITARYIRMLVNTGTAGRTAIAELDAYGPLT